LRISSDEVMNRVKNELSKLIFGDRLEYRAARWLNLKDKLQIFSYLINNLHFYFANLATLSNRQLYFLRQIKSETKRRWKYN
jgi:hypothetical protein